MQESVVDTGTGAPARTDDRVPTSQGGESGSVRADSPDGSAGVFDLHRPPSDERISDCVHCGFCLPTCPTYAIWGEEMDSPRGRIYLMKLGKEGAVEMDDTYVQHFDACLGCMACVQACPSGVKYNELIEAVRPQIERNYKRSWSDSAFRRMIFELFPHPGRLRAAVLFGMAYQRTPIRRVLHQRGMLAKLPPRLRALEALLPAVKLSALTAGTQIVTAPVGTKRRRVGMLTGCVQRVFFGDVNAATVRVLAAEGCEVIAPEQGCCGALMLHAGREEPALERARELIDVFERAEVDAVVVNVAGCGSSMKEYGHLLADDPAYAERAKRFSDKVRDISELLAELEPVAARTPIDARVAYHDACHLANAQGIKAQPRKVLRTIPDLEVVDIPEAEICCGSAGIYNLVMPEPAEELGRRKVANIASTSPDAIVTANAGCLLQIRRYLDDGVPLFHPVQVLDASIRGVPLITRRRSAGTVPAGQGPRSSEPPHH